MTDIVEQLETEAKYPGSDKWMLREAAKIIRQLRAEIRDGKAQSKEAIRELRAEIERLNDVIKQLNEGNEVLATRYCDSKTEIERLKALLEER